MMTITKFGQCCLLIDVAGKRIVTDPGRFTSGQNELTDIDLILITHEHADHFHSTSVEALLERNPQATVVTNSSVGELLAKLGIQYEVLEGTAQATQAGIALEAHDGPHVEIFEQYGLVQNTGYFIADELFYPGDAYTNPGKAVPILALPVAGPWCKVSDAIRYADEVAPKKAFPVHDWLLNEDGLALTYSLVNTQLEAKGIDFTPLRNGETATF